MLASTWDLAWSGLFRWNKCEMGYIVTYFKMQVGDGYSGGHFFNVVRSVKCPGKIMEKKLLLPHSTFGGKELSLQSSRR